MMLKIKIQSLSLIFFNKNRILNDHERAYKFIIDSSEKDFFVLLRSLDGSKLTIESLLESISKRNDHFGFYPEISTSVLDYIRSTIPNKFFFNDITFEQFLSEKKLVSKFKYLLYKSFKLFFIIMSNLLILASIFYFLHPLIKKWNLPEDSDKWKLDKKDHLYKKDINQSYIMQEIIQLLEIKINETMTNHTNEDEMLNDLINGIKNDDIPSLDKCGNLFEFGHIVEQNNTFKYFYN